MPARVEALDLAPSGFFVLRTPLLPFDEFLKWSDGLEAPAFPGAHELADALERDRALLRGRLRQLVTRPEVCEAIFVASPLAGELIEKWLADPDPESQSGLERALVRYLARMTGRSTPFGLFAGVSTGAIADGTRLVIESREGYRRATRLDAEYLLKVVEGVLSEGERRESLAYRPNPTLYRAGARRRFIRSQPSAEEGRHRLVSVRESGALETALSIAEGGATRARITAALMGSGAAEERARRYVDDLIDQRVLIPEPDLRVTGGDAVYDLAESGPGFGALGAARTALAALDASAIGASPAVYRHVASLLAALPVPAEINRLVQVDMAKPGADATLGKDVVGEILRGAELLRRIGAGSQDQALERFMERFRDRYEGQSVPLLEALDPDFGVPFDEDDQAPAPLIAGLGGGAGLPPAKSWGAREEHLLARVFEVQATAAELVLTQRDIEKLEREDALPLPDACAVMAILASPSAADLAHGNFRVCIEDVSGPSGARLLGRFCHTDFRLQAEVEKHLRAEEALDADAIFAEIVHLPRARDVNVVARPVLRDYEIPCLGQSGAPPERQIPLTDLLVSVEDGRIVLRSRRLGRRVIPRLSSAHNFSSRGVAVYRFLCRIQSQGVASGLGFWGPLGSAPRLPRVRHGRVVLATARWRLDAHALGQRGDATADYRAIQEWRRTWRVPRFVAQTEFGGQLPVDLDNVLAVESLVHDVRSRETAYLVELFPPPAELCVSGPEGAFVHELVVPFVRPAKPPGRPERAPSGDIPVQRLVPPGAEWVYVRLYTGETVADTLLTDVIAPLAQEFVSAGVADSWFFMRYRDPRYHLRVRFRGDPARVQAEAVPALQAAARRLVADGLVWRVEFGTYNREVERYGGPESIDLAESIFHADSDAVLGILPLLDPGEAGQEERWRLGFAGSHQLLVDLGLDAAQRLALVRSQRDALALRLGWDGDALGRVGARFRKERKELDLLLNPVPGESHPLEPGLDVLRERSSRLAPLAERLEELERAGRLTMSRPAIASSLLHMYLNRLVRGDNVAQELVICDFLNRLYEAGARRGREG